MFYRFDITKWILVILPPALRRPLLFSLLNAMLIPVKAIYENFMSYKTSIDRQLASNACTIYLERYLNDLFYLSGDIYITDYIDEDKVYMAFADELADPVYVGTVNEPEMLYLSSESPDGFLGGFIVNIPEFLNKPEYITLIDKWVTFFKYAGTKHIIQTYNG